MANFSRAIVKALTKRINKSLLLKDATSAIENATERAQDKLLKMQNVATKKYRIIVKQVNGATITQDLSAPPLKPTGPIPERLINWWQWYQRLTGLDTVESAKQQVIHVQEKLFKCQEERRNITHQAALVNDKLKEIYGELIQTKRDDPKYVNLTIMENKGLQEQTRFKDRLALLEDEERDHFTQLATAIKEYHESQAMNAQKYKYISILASALLAIVSLAGSMVYNNRRISDVRHVIADAQKKTESSLKDYFQSVEKTSSVRFATIMSKINSLNIQAASQSDRFSGYLGTDDGVGADVPEIGNENYTKLAINAGMLVISLYILQQIFKS